MGPILPLPSRQVALQFVQGSVPTVDPVPRVYEPVPHNLLHHKYHFVLQFFSGQRRSDDIQDSLDKFLCQEGQQLPVIVLSVDRINGILGDLTNPDTIAFWLRTVRERKTLAILGGPPCETWTAAKFMELFHLDGTPRKGPRPTRYADCLWGIDKLTTSEARSIQFGNQLFRTMLTFMHAARLHGVAALMEHAEFPSWVPASKKPPSSLLVPEMIDLVATPETDRPLLTKVLLALGLLSLPLLPWSICHMLKEPWMGGLISPGAHGSSAKH